MTARKQGVCPRCLKPWRKGHHHGMPPRASLAERFERKVMPEPTSGCHLWMAARNSSGYGLIGRGPVGAGQEKAHRAAWLLAGREIPQGLNVLHKCDVPPCVRLEHLFLGTQADNNADRDRKGRWRGPVGESHPFARLTAEIARAIRSRYAGGGVSQSQVAAEFGISKAHVSHITSGRKWRSA